MHCFFLLGGDVHIHCHLWTIFRFFSLQSGNVNDELRISGRNVFDALKLCLCVYHWRGPGRASAHGSAMPRLSQLKTTLISGPSLPHTCKCCAHRATVPPCQLAWLKYLTRAMLLPIGHGAVEAEHAVCLRCACFHLTSIHLTPFWVNQM